MTTRRDLEAALEADDVAAALWSGLETGWLDALIPELRAEMDFVQRTRYHAYTNLDHSFRVAAAMPPVLTLRLAGLFHDLGKRRTTTIKERNGEEQYLGHAGVGAGMAEIILIRLGYDRPLVRHVRALIALHMDLHTAANNAWSVKAQTKLLERVGDLLPELEVLQLADIDAMHPELVPEMRSRALQYHAALAITLAG